MIFSKKILILCDEISKVQPVWNFIVALSKSNFEYRVICNFDFSNSLNSNIISINKPQSVSNIFSKLGIILFKKDLSYFSFENYVNSNFDELNEGFDFDLVLSFTTGSSLFIISLGYKLAKKNKKPLFIHTVDPLPSVKGWGEKQIYRLAMIKMLRKSFNYAKFFSANNEWILNYQVKLMQFKGNSICLPTVIINDFKIYSAISKQVFLYAGSFYGKRTPDALLLGFKEYLKLCPNAVLKIVGNNNIDLDNYLFNPIEKKQVKILGFINNLDELLKEASVLIDIDANVPNDVFISGKLINYINTSKIILSISPPNSPTSIWMEKINESVISTDYKIENIVNGFEKSFLASKKNNPENVFANREEFLEKFNSKNVINAFSELIDDYKS